MKRTKSIRYAAFRKSWQARHLTPVAIAVSAVFMLAGCEQNDETVSMYQNADDCSKANPGQSAQCTTAFNEAKKRRNAPRQNMPRVKIVSLNLVKTSVSRHRLRRAWAPLMPNRSRVAAASGCH